MNSSMLSKLTVFMLSLVVVSANAMPGNCLNTLSFSEGVEYQLIRKPLSSKPDIVEFFSFYCKPCYLFSGNETISKTIQAALDNKKIAKYHVSLMGPLGDELTEAWAIANVLGKADVIERLLFEEVQSGHVSSVEDIKETFLKAGVKKSDYVKLQSSDAVQDYVKLQKNAVNEFEVSGTPSFYIKGKYKIINSGITFNSIEQYCEDFANLIKLLTEK